MTITLNGSGSITGLTSGAGIAATALSGQVPDANAPSGSVIQVVSSVVTAGFSSSSSSFVTTGLAASITPLSASNKILVIASLQTAQLASNQPINETIYRNSTNLGNATFGIAGTYAQSGGYTVTTNSLVYLDSPATTSSTTYTIYARSETGSSFSLGANGQPLTITLMEIAA